MNLKNIIVGQSGGPTAAINATLAGVIAEGIKNSETGTVYGMVNGIKGFLNENIINLTEIFSDNKKLELLKQTPSAFLGSCRYKVSEANGDIERIIEIMLKYEIGYFLYIGGNDSMDTVLMLRDKCAVHGIKVIGVPKTIDNDLNATDHCPGFGSAAKYIAATVAEITHDAKCYDIKSVTLVEIMGRDAGWLTASSALARLTGMSSPELIYLPEVPFDTEKFLKDVEQLVNEKQSIVITLSEGIKDKDGKYVFDQSSAFKEDLFGHVQLGGAGKTLENLIKQKLGIKCRSIELNTPQRCAAHIASKTDITESVQIGASAVRAAVNGESGKMMIYKRVSNNPYKIEFDTQDIADCANEAKSVPAEFISSDGNDVTKEFIDYVLPLIQGEVDYTYENGLPVHIMR